MEARQPEPASARPRSSLGHATRAVLRLVGDAWTIAGITLLLFVAIDGLYRLVRTTGRPRDLAAEPVTAEHPYADSTWFRGLRHPDAAHLGHYDPYRGWWPVEYHSQWINVDSAGLRRTPQTVDSTQQAIRVFVLGGSSMWGSYARDGGTVPSLLADRLRRRGVNARVTNFGQLAFNSTQEVITLLLELRKGNRPDVVVLVDGHNDISNVVESGSPGHITGEPLARQRFERTEPGLGGYLLGTSHYSALVEDLSRSARRPEEPRWPAPPYRLCRAAGGFYLDNAIAVQGLARSFGFSVVRAWQPTRAASGKRLTQWESSFSTQGWRGIHREMQAACADTVATIMAKRPDVPFQSFTSLFDHDSGEVFLDDFGHLTERANGVMADTLAGLILSSMQRQKHPVPMAAASARQDVP